MIRPALTRWLTRTDRFWEAVLGRRPTARRSPLRPVEPLEDRVVMDGRPKPLPMLFAGSGPGVGSAPLVRVYDGDTGAEAFTVTAYEAAFTGGVNVTAVDLNADTVPDLVTGPGAGGGPRVRVFDGKTGDPLDSPVSNFWAFDESFTGGITVAAGDVTGDGVPDVVAAVAADGEPRVRVFDGATGDLVADFLAFDPSFTGGVNVAVADLTLDGKAEVVVGAGAGGGSHVKAFDLSSGLPVIARGFFTNFLADGAEARGGATVAVADVNGDAIPDVIAGPAAGPGGRVKVFNGFDGSVMSDFAVPGGAAGGVHVSAFYLTDDRYADVVVSTGSGGTNRVQVFNAGTGQLVAGPMSDFAAFPGGAGGAVAAANDPGTAAVGFVYMAYASGLTSGQSFQLGLGVTSDGLAAPIEDDGPPPPPGPTPTGTMTFYVQTSTNTIPLGEVPLVASGSSGMAELTVTGLTLDTASYTFLATYSGDSYYASASTAVPVPASVLMSGPTPTPVSSAPSPGGGGSPESSPAGADRNNMSSVSAGGVRVGDGAVSVTRVDFTAAAVGGSGWTQGWSWTNASDYADPEAGAGATLLSSPKVVQLNGDDSLAVVTAAGAATFFDWYGGGYHARYSVQGQLTRAGGLFTFTDGRGNSWSFYDFSVGTPAGRAGRMTAAATADGTTTSVTSWDGAGRPAEMQRVTGAGGSAVTESLVTTYVSGGDNDGLIASATLRRKVGGGSWTTVRAAAYTYYADTDNHGRATQLKLAEVKDGAANVLDTSYYRYDVPGSGVGPLAFAFGPAAYARLTTALGTSVDALTDAQVDEYADDALTYDVDGRVATRTLAGAGSSVTAGGRGTYTYTYAANTAVQGGVNVWKTRTTEVLPDGNEYEYYANSSGQVMLKAYTDTTTSDQWIWYEQFDAGGRTVLAAGPSAVTGYDDSYADLVNDQGGNFQYLADAAGLVTRYTYAATTTATTAAAGDAAGFQTGTAVRRGELGTDVPQTGMTYIARTVGGVNLFFPSATTRYRNDNGTGAQTTTAAYTWQGSTATAASVTTTLPTVTTAQNGPNAATTVTTVNDALGRPVWSKDAAGFLTYVEYDDKTGAVVKAVADVDTTQTGDFANLPSGWTTPAGGGLHQISTFEVDALGRVTKSTSPGGRVDYTVYDDANFEVRSYPAWDAATNTPTGPTSVSRYDRAGGYSETLTLSATPSVSGGRPTGAEAIANVESLSRSYRNTAGQVTHSDAYFDLTGVTYSTAANLGTLNTNYYRTTTAYGMQAGRLNKKVSAAGTITRTEYDGLGRAVSVWVGTDDTPTAGFWAVTNLTGTDMVKVAAYEYDGGTVGDGNLTSVTQFPGGGSAARVTETFYDWRNRAVAVKAGVEATENLGVNRPISYTDYDNLGQVTKTRTYDGDGVTISSTSGVPNLPSSSLLRSQYTTSYDELGRAYRTDESSIDPASGNAGAYTRVTQTWFDARGQVLKTASPGGLVKKTSYDGVGRATVSSSTDGGGDAGYGDADDVTGDLVLSQDETSYDADGNALATTHRDRFHDATDTGSLGTPASASGTAKGRVSYTGFYRDLANRPVAVVDVGTNGGSAWTRPGSVPARGDSTLVTSTSYDAAGMTYETTDPRGVVTRNLYDDLGRKTKTVENYVNGVVDSAYDDKTTEYAYGPSGMSSLTAKLEGGGVQTTAWVYGVSTAAGSAITSNDIAAATKWPSPATGAASSSEMDTLTANALGQPVTTTDRNGSTHTLTYDVLGRVVSDAVTTLGSGVSGGVRRIETAYDGLGNAFLVTGYDAAAGGSVVTQVQRAYNGLGQLTREWQATGGSVNTGTTPSVQYAYSEMPGGANHSRLTSITYPSGYVLTYNYAAGLDDNVSRLSSLSDATGTVEGYEYLGVGTVVARSRPQPGVDLTFLGTGPGAGGDQYVGLDSFGRVVDQNWTDGTTSTDRFTYTYDRNGNRLTRGNSVNPAFSESYEYDGMDQLAYFERGTHTQGWEYDAVGNIIWVTTDGNLRTQYVNKQNEITSYTSGTKPTYDANGNMTGDETGRKFVYDAWNRLVTVKNSSGTTIKTYTYDGLNRRVQDTAGGTTTDLYYSTQWQVLEEQVSGSTSARYVWSPAYVDAMILRDRATTTPGTINERVWVQQDANFNVTAITDGTGAVLERYAYDPFGKATALDPTTWTALGGGGVGTAFDWKYLHQGGRADGASGLYYFRNRDYSPSLGRWASMDPISYKAGDVNLYRYVGNNGVNSIDPLGLSKWPAWLEKLIGVEGGAGEGGGTITSVTGVHHDTQHQGGAHVDVHYVDENGANRVQRFHPDGRPYTEFENHAIQNQPKRTKRWRKFGGGGGGKFQLALIAVVALPAIASAAETGGVRGAVNETVNQGNQLAQSAVNDTILSATVGMGTIVAADLALGTTVTVGGAAVTTVAGATGVGAAVTITAVAGYEVGNYVGQINVGGQSIHDHIADGMIWGLDALGLW